MKKFLVFSLFAIILFACRPNQQQDVAPLPFSLPVNEDELVLRLSSDLVAEPQTNWEWERNAILNYAIDHLLDVQASPSGLYWQLLEAGQGDTIRWGDKLRAHYRGYFLDGREFDSSYQRNKPIEFYVGNMIDGWNEALLQMQPGAAALLLVPSHLGYGEKGLTDSRGNVLVPPNTVLVFEIKVLEKR